jgi:hypothetical protein
MARHQHRFHGDPNRFDAIADFVDRHFGNSVKYIAEVAGGQGMLSRLLNKKYGYISEVVDPRGWVMRGVPNRQVEFGPPMADYYDLIVGVHPDEATRAVAESSLIRPTILVPCCNFWSDEKLGRDELIDAIAGYYLEHHVGFERLTFPFSGPKNLGLVTHPPRRLCRLPPHRQ